MSATAANLPALPSSLTPEGNLSRYLQEIRKFRCSSRSRSSCWPRLGASMAIPKPPISW